MGVIGGILLIAIAIVLISKRRKRRVKTHSDVELQENPMYRSSSRLGSQYSHLNRVVTQPPHYAPVIDTNKNSADYESPVEMIASQEVPGLSTAEPSHYAPVIDVTDGRFRPPSQSISKKAPNQYAPVIDLGSSGAFTIDSIEKPLQQPAGTIVELSSHYAPVVDVLAENTYKQDIGAKSATTQHGRERTASHASQCTAVVDLSKPVDQNTAAAIKPVSQYAVVIDLHADSEDI